VLIFLAERFFTTGIKEKAKKASLETRVAEEKLKQGLNIEKDKDLIQSEYKTYEPYLKQEPQDTDVVAKFLKEIENITQSSGVLVLNLTPENMPEKEEGYKKFRADLKAEASLDQLFAFLYRIQDSKLLIKLDKVSIAPKDESASTFRIDTTISIASL